MIIERATIIQDAEYLAENLRETDIREMKALSDANIRQRVVGSFLASRITISVFDDDKLLGIFGVAECKALGQGHGLIWLLGTKHLTPGSYQREFVALGRKWIPVFLSGFEVLENFIYEKNSASLRWLRHFGFTFENARPYGPKGNLFRHFSAKTGDLKNV